MKQKVANYTVKIAADKNGNFFAHVPAMPVCDTGGKSIEETVLNARRSIIYHLEALEELGLPRPKEE